MNDKFLLRLPPGKLKKIKNKSSTLGLSVNQYINLKLESNETSESSLVEIIKKSSLSSKIIALVLFGSVAKKTSDQTSDFDLLIVLDEHEKISRSLYAVWDTEVDCKLTPVMTDGKIASPHFVNFKSDLKDIHGLWLEIAISGIVLWKKNDKIDLLLQKMRTAIADNLFTRKLTHGQPYWIRKI